VTRQHKTGKTSPIFLKVIIKTTCRTAVRSGFIRLSYLGTQLYNVCYPAF